MLASLRIGFGAFHTDRGGRVTRYVYDADLRLVATIEPGDNPDDSTNNPTTKLVYEASRATQIPVIALGGIERAEDILEYITVGASAVQIGTASFADPQACEKIASELERLCVAEKIIRINDLKGTFRPENG